ncbi:lipid-A-disaccharide synthase [Bythopirellula polymerisocia]|uniref:Lipid-A-disaccharide synthase n=1 Tax=Bythopirellula polymerisocia TaxID=2528003 RepID=A0A5C6CCU5_9BACT|nr:lipid-A-disaccharide synthase [Bythopirellula polymerisocia]TWU21942.1 Glycosyl transferase [Bythopirellula polymerisocia]
MQIFFSVGEPSGDLHGANLIRALRERDPDCEFVGYGGPKMAAAGCHLHADLTQLAVMWVAQVILNYGKFLGLLAAADQYFRNYRPDAVVLIDYPGFNWHIARRAKAHGIPVIYYGTPQLWAWASWRVSKMRRFVDHVLCKLPFEEKWFRKRGCQATFVGHPFFDELEAQQADEEILKSLNSQNTPLVTILPGSRTQEVKGNLPEFLKAAQLIRQRVPQVSFAVAAFKEQHRDMARQMIDQSGVDVELYVGQTPELIQAARCCLACSGSVSLELLFHTKPTAILYKISRLGYLVQRVFRKVRYITLVNLLTAKDPFAERRAGHYDKSDSRDNHVLMPEYLTCRDCTADLADHVVQWLTSADDHERNVQGLADLKARIGHGGASQRAAEYISRLLRESNENAGEMNSAA